jgi:branched-chain amino acid transport system ATP-binding protein
VLEVRGLSVRYGDIAAVRGIDLRVDRGEIVALVGANGAGKTTTLKAIAGALRYDGEILFEGTALNPRASAHERARRGLVLVPEGRGILGRMSVEDAPGLGPLRRRAAGAGDRAGSAGTPARAHAR